MKINNEWMNQQRVPDNDAPGNVTKNEETLGSAADGFAAEEEITEIPDVNEEEVPDTEEKPDVEEVPAIEEEVSDIKEEAAEEGVSVVNEEPVVEETPAAYDTVDYGAVDYGDADYGMPDTGDTDYGTPDTVQKAETPLQADMPLDKKSAKKAAKAAKKAAKVGKKKSVLPWIILGSFVVAVAAYGVAIHVQTRVLSAYDKTTVYVAGSMMADGHVMDESEAASLTGSVELPIGAVPADAVTDLSVIVNSAARYDITPGTILCSSMFETVDEMQAGLTNPVIAGFRSDDIYQVAGGVLRPGDTISIYTVDNTSSFGTAIYEGTLRWDNIRVQDVFESSGTRISSTDKTTPAARVNIYMDKSEIEEFYARLASGSLRVVVHCN